MSGETLIDRINRAKARWLKRVMYASSATSTQKVFAYAISDHLNCVTVDCWPAQKTLTRLLGRSSNKTAQRAARGLKALGFITIRSGTRERSGQRYAPVFHSDDWDNSGNGRGRNRAESADTDVPQSSLSIQLKSSSRAFRKAKEGNGVRAPFKPAERGAIEIRLAGMLGPNGFEILGRLEEIDDAIVDRLCRALAEDQLGDRELSAARLAAEQAR